MSRRSRPRRDRARIRFVADWCLAPNGVECINHDENGDCRA